MTTQIKGDATSTFGSDIDVTGNVITDAPAFSAYALSNTSLANGTSTKVLFDTEVFDLTNDFASSTFTPSVAGYYQINASVWVDGANSQNQMQLKLYKNGSNYSILDIIADSTLQDTTVANSTLVYCNGTTDYLEIYVYHNMGVTKNAQGNGNKITYFNGYLARAV